jgi:cell division protein FtsN
MRIAITLARAHGEEAFTLIADNTVPFREQLAAFKAVNLKTHPEFAELMIWQSDAGIVKRARFAAPGSVKQTEPVKTEPANAEPVNAAPAPDANLKAPEPPRKAAAPAPEPKNPVKPAKR